MKARLIIMATILFNMLSCKMGSNKFDIIESKGLDVDNLRLNAMMFYNKDTGFIVGSSDTVTHNPDFPKKDSNQFAFVKRTALLFKTTDGCRTWTKKDFGEGYLNNILLIKDVVFAFKQSDDYSHIFVYSSHDLGRTWDDSVSFPKGIYNLVSVGNELCAIGTDSSKRVTYFYRFDDGGRSWSSGYISYYYPFDNPIEYNDKILYLTKNKQGAYFPDKLVVHDVKANTDSVIELPKELNCYFLTNCNGEIRLTGLRDGLVAVYSLQKGNRVKYEYSCLKEPSYFPQGYYNNKNEEWIVVGKKGDADMSNEILKTTDNGRSWEVISFIKDKYIKPFYFLDDNGKVEALFFSGAGKFQVMQ
jgi:hypothetical protein